MIVDSNTPWPETSRIEAEYCPMNHFNANQSVFFQNTHLYDTIIPNGSESVHGRSLPPQSETKLSAQIATIWNVRWLRQPI